MPLETLQGYPRSLGIDGENIWPVWVLVRENMKDVLTQPFEG